MMRSLHSVCLRSTAMCVRPQSHTRSSAQHLHVSEKKVSVQTREKSSQRPNSGDRTFELGCTTHGPGLHHVVCGTGTKGSVRKILSPRSHAQTRAQYRVVSCQHRSHDGEAAHEREVSRTRPKPLGDPKVHGHEADALAQSYGKNTTDNEHSPPRSPRAA
jgi:hypothetical protein